MIRDRKDIPRFKDAGDADWSDYHWQMRNRLTTTEDFDRVLNLHRRAARRPRRLHGQVPRQRDAVLRVAHGPGRPAPTRCACRPCPRRPSSSSTPRTSKDAVCRGLRLTDAAPHAPLPRPRAVRGHRHVQHVLPPLHAPAPGRRQRGRSSPRRDRQRDQVHRALPRGPRRAHQRRRPAGAQRRAARGHHQPRARHRRTWRSSASARACRSSARSASRPSWSRCCKQVPPALLQHALQPPAGVHAGEQAGVRPSGRRRHQPGQPVGAACAASTTHSRRDEGCRTNCCSTASAVLLSTSATSRRARPTSAPAC